MSPAVWGNLSYKVHSAGPLEPVHLLTPPSPQQRGFWFVFFHSEGTLWDTSCYLTLTRNGLKSERRGQTTLVDHRSGEKTWESRGKLFPEFGWSGWAPAGREPRQRPADSSGSPGWAGGSLPIPRKSNGRVGKGKKAPSYLAGTTIVLFSPRGKIDELPFAHARVNFLMPRLYFYF